MTMLLSHDQSKDYIITTCAKSEKKNDGATGKLPLGKNIPLECFLSPIIKGTVLLLSRGPE